MGDHLANTGSSAEIAINLERWMRIKKICICACRRKLALQDRPGALRIAEASPKAGAPANTPTGGIIAPDIERVFGCRCQLGRLDRVDRQTGIKRIKM